MGVAGDSVGPVIGERFAGDATVSEERLSDSDDDDARVRCSPPEPGAPPIISPCCC